MEDRQKELIQTSFEKILPIGDEIAELFYNRVFELDPSLRPLFQGDMKTQGENFMGALWLVVSGLNGLDEIIPVLQNLGRNHVAYGVEASHYGLIGDSLIWTLEQGLKEQFTEEVRDAWLAIYQVLSEVMLGAAAEVEKGSA